LANEDADQLFWQLAGKATADAWAWWRKPQSWGSLTETASTAGNTFTQFWYGKIDKANAWEKDKLHLKGVQDALRTHGKLPGLLDLAANPFLLTAIIYL
jgi:hypothetical protein